LKAASSGGSEEQYTYKGCNVYSAGDWLTADLVNGPVNSYVPKSIDPNSSTIMSYLESTYGDLAWYSPAQEVVNTFGTSTSTFALTSRRTET